MKQEINVDNVNSFYRSFLVCHLVELSLKTTIHFMMDEIFVYNTQFDALSETDHVRSDFNKAIDHWIRPLNSVRIA
jgi:transcription elongation factor Elf1